MSRKVSTSIRPAEIFKVLDADTGEIFDFGLKSKKAFIVVETETIETEFVVPTKIGDVKYVAQKENYPYGHEVIYSASTESKSVSIRIQMNDDGGLNLKLPVRASVVKKDHSPLRKSNYTMMNYVTLEEILADPFGGLNNTL